MSERTESHAMPRSFASSWLGLIAISATLVACLGCASWDKADEADTTPYQGSPYLDILTRFSKAFIEQGRQGYPAEKLGELVHHALTTSKPKVRYAAVKGRAMEKLVMRFASKRSLDRLVGKTLGLLPPLDQR